MPTLVPMVQARILCCTNSLKITIYQCTAEVLSIPTEINLRTDSVKLQVVGDQLVVTQNAPVPDLWLSTEVNLGFSLNVLSKDINSATPDFELSFIGTEDLRPCFFYPARRIAPTTDGAILHITSGKLYVSYAPAAIVIERYYFHKSCC